MRMSSGAWAATGTVSRASAVSAMRKRVASTGGPRRRWVGSTIRLGLGAAHSSIRGAGQHLAPGCGRGLGWLARGSGLLARALQPVERLDVLHAAAQVARRRIL